jgi:hypothetical protein
MLSFWKSPIFFAWFFDPIPLTFDKLWTPSRSQRALPFEKHLIAASPPFEPFVVPVFWTSVSKSDPERRSVARLWLNQNHEPSPAASRSPSRRCSSATSSRFNASRFNAHWHKSACIVSQIAKAVAMPQAITHSAFAL